MDEEENKRRKEEQEDSGIKKGIKTAESGAKKLSKFVKTARRVIAFILAHIWILKILLPLLVIGILVLIFSLKDDDGNNRLASVASKALLEDKEITDIAYDEDNGYYFTISDNVVKKFIEELEKAYTSGEYDRDEYDEGDLVDEEDEDDEDAEAEEFEYDEEDAEYKKETILDWFKTDDEDLMKSYLVKMLRAQIASSYPKFGEYEGLEKTADRQGNKKDKLKGGDYVAQGIVEIQRARMTNDGQVADKPTPLTYLPYDKEGVEKTFKSLIDAKKPEALNYYSFDSSKGVLYYATYKEVVVTVNGVVDESASSYVIKENPISYKALASMCSMPFNFTFSLLQVSENPEWVMAVIDLLLEKSEVVLMIQDQMNITIYEEVWSQGQMTTRTPTYGKEETDTDIDEMGMEVSYTYYVWEDGETYTSYRFPPEDAYNKEKVIVTTTYTNTANVFIQKANTWCINFEQSVGDEPKVSENYGDRVYYTQGNDYSDEDIINLAPYTTLVFNNLPQRPSASEGSYYLVTKKYVSDNRLIHSTKLDNISYTWKTTVLHEKEINHEKFLGLWKNKTGAYNKNGDNLYDPNGKEVAYTLPPPKDNVKSYAASDITSNMQEDRIDTIIELLQRHGDTQNHEQFMMYFWNKYYGEDVYDVNENDLLNLFSTYVATTFTSSYGSISLHECTLTRDEFIECVENYDSNSTYQEGFAKYAGVIYDICTANNINPILCVAQAGQEQGFKAPSNLQYNFWGYAVYNNTNTGRSFNTMEQAVKAYCDLLNDYSTPGTSANTLCVERVTEYSKYYSQFNPSNINVYFCMSRWKWLGWTHDSIIWGSVTAKQFIDDYLKKYLSDDCSHSITEETTWEERAADIIWYVEDGLVPIAKRVFGDKAVISAGEGVTKVGDYEYKTYTSAVNGRTYIWYRQNFGPWQNERSGSGYTLNKSGCYATAVTIVASGYGSTKIPSWNNNLYNMLNTQSHNLGRGCPSDSTGGKDIGINSSDYQTIVDWISSGGEVIIHVLGRTHNGHSDYTSAQHWMPLVDISEDGSQVYVMDPYTSSNRKEGWQPLSEILKSLCCYHLVTGIK